MSRGFTPRHAQTAGDLDFAMQFNAETFRIAPLFSGLIVPRITRDKVYYLHSSQVRHIMSNTLLPVISRLPRPTGSACTDTGAVLPPLSNGGTRVSHWQSTRGLWIFLQILKQEDQNYCRN